MDIMRLSSAVSEKDIKANWRAFLRWLLEGNPELKAVAVRWILQHEPYHAVSIVVGNGRSDMIGFLDMHRDCSGDARTVPWSRPVAAIEASHLPAGLYAFPKGEVDPLPVVMSALGGAANIQMVLAKACLALQLKLSSSALRGVLDSMETPA